jgi:hypothetical protein
MSQDLNHAYEQELNDNLFVLELEERLEMVQAGEAGADAVVISCCLDGSAAAV